MEKATAELDGTLVFNYIIEIDDDNDVVQIHETQAAGEVKLDTSFDENQNPKLQSKATVEETLKNDKDLAFQSEATNATTAEETPKKDKDLVVLLVNRVLTPRKLLSAVDEDKTNDPAAAKLDDASIETSNLQPLNLTKVQSSSLRMKRARSSEIIKDAPKTKKVKTKNVSSRKLTDSVGTKELGSIKPKRGRPKSLGTNMLVSFAGESHSTPKETEVVLLEGKQDAVQEITDLEIRKPMRGRPKKLKKLNSSVKTIELEHSIPKISKAIVEDKLSNAVSSIDLSLVKPKRGRPKSSGTKKVDVSTVTSLKLFIAEKLQKRGVEPKQLKALVDMTQPQPCNDMETNFKAEQQNAMVESTGLDPLQSKKGKPKGFKVKKDSVGITEGITNLKLSDSQKIKAGDLPKPKKGRPKGYKVKKNTVSIDSTESNTNLKLSDSQKIEAGDPPKPKKGRPKGSKIKKSTVSIDITEGITNLNLSDSQKLETEDLKAKEIGSLISIDVSNNLESSKTTTLKALGLEAKQAVTSGLQESAVTELGTLISARTKYLVPSKVRRGRSKGLKLSLKTKKVTFSLNNSKLTELNSSAGTDSSKPSMIEAVDLVVKQADASVNADMAENNLEALKSAADLVVKQADPSLNADMSENNLEALKCEKTEDNDLVATELDVTAKIDKLKAPKSKRGRPKGPVTKKHKKLAAVIDLDCPESSEVDITNVKPKQLDASVNLIDAPVNLIDAPVNLIDAPVNLIDAPVNLIDSSVNLIDAPVNPIDVPVNLIDAPGNLTVPETLKSSSVKAKKVRAKKVIDSVVRTMLPSAKSTGTKKSGLNDKQDNTAMEIIDLDAPKPKKIKAKVLGPRKDHVSVAAKCLKLIKAKATKNNGSKEKNDAVIETIDLEAPKVKIAQFKEVVSKKINDASRVGGTGTRPKGVRAKQLVGIKRNAFSHPNKPAGYVEDEKQVDIVEIIDLQLPKPKTGGLKKNFGAKTVKTLVATEPQPSTSKESIETIDLELPKPKKGRKQGLEIKKINLCDKTKDLEPPEVNEVNIGTVNEKNRSSQHENVDGKGKRKVGTSDGNKDFKFPKPKRPKTLLAKTKRVVGFVATKDTKQTETENAQTKLDASVGTKDMVPPKSKESDAQSLPRKPMLCTVGTQTLEEEEEDVLKALEVKTTVRKTSVSSIGTQVIEPLKLNETEVKDSGRKISVSSIEVFNVNAPAAKTTGGRKAVEKGLNASVGKKPFEPALPKGAKASESEDKTEQDDEETFKIEDDLIQPVLTLEENTELGVKYETVEQIHTEFKYESQSETEQMMKRRRGKLGGPMRGRRRGANKMEGQTTIDSFFRIVDLNGKLQMKNKNSIYKCDHCLYVGNSKANLERHSLIHRSADEIMWFHCTECPYKSKYEHQLKSHFLIHMKPDQIHFFHCPHCDIKCSRKHNLTNHIKSIHADRENSFKCAECPYTTFSKDRLVAHLRKHSKEVHACTLCKFVTKRREYLDSHFKMKHTAEVPRPFPCDTCSYKGKTKRELDKHYDRMHNKEQLHAYQCNHCTFNSIYKKNLEFHLLHMHNNSEGFQKFICGHCQKSFSYKNGLKVHIIRCHIKLPDDDWHKCMECKYKSKDVSTLKRHIKRNHGAPRLHCKQCSFATNRQTSMDAHLKTHEYDNEDILKCPECPYRIIQMSSFQYHMKVIHGKPMTYKEALQYYMQDE